MPDLLVELHALGEVARVRTLRRRGVPDRVVAAALATGSVFRPRHGWVASHLADADQLRAIAVGARIGCHSALRRFGVWAGTSPVLHLQAPRTASRLDPVAPLGPPVHEPHSGVGVWHPSIRPAARDGRAVRLSAAAPVPRVHWRTEHAPSSALDWVVSPHAALATALRCLDDEHARAAIDSILHERVLARSQVDAVLSSLPREAAGMVDEFTGLPESGVESLFVRRMSNAGFHVVPQFEFPPHGRYDGVIDGCVLFEIDGRGFHSSSASFFRDRDETLVAQSFGVPVVRPSALHVLDHWPATFAAVARVVEDARLVRRARGLAPIR